MAEPVSISNRPFWAIVFTVFWVVEIVFGGFIIATGVSWLGGRENGAAVVIILGGVLVMAAGVMMVDVSWQVARLKGAAIEITPQGFRDRRLNETVIAWADITHKVVFNGRAYSLQFDLTPQARAGYCVSWGNRMMGALNRFFKYPEFTIVTLGTGKTAHEIARLMDKTQVS